MKFLQKKKKQTILKFFTKLSVGLSPQKKKLPNYFRNKQIKQNDSRNVIR